MALHSPTRQRFERAYGGRGIFNCVYSHDRRRQSSQKPSILQRDLSFENWEFNPTYGHVFQISRFCALPHCEYVVFGALSFTQFVDVSAKSAALSCGSCVLLSARGVCKGSLVLAQRDELKTKRQRALAQKTPVFGFFFLSRNLRSHLQTFRGLSL